MPDVLGWLSGLLGNGDPEAQGAAQASTAMQPQVLDYAQRVLSGQIAREGVLGQPRPYDPALSYRQNVPDTRASLEPAIDVAMGIGPGAIRAFHGSPFDFSRYSLSKIGTGEGGATFGKGINLAEDARVAEGYRDSLSREGGGRGYVYETNINADPSRLLEWSKPLSQQSEIVKRGLADLGGRLQPITDVKQYVQSFLSTDYAKSFPRASDVARARRALESGDLEDMVEWAGKQTGPGSSAFNLVGPFATPADRLTGGNILRRLDEKTLESAGIAGTKYAPPERTAAPGTSNYVVFNPSILDIRRKYGIVPPLAGAGALAAAGSEPPT